MANFVWGPNGEMLTPEEVDRMREMSALAAQRAGDTSPVGHWTQGMARLVDGFGAYRSGVRAAEAEKAGLASADEFIKNNPALAGYFGNAGMTQEPLQVTDPFAGEASPVVGALTGGNRLVAEQPAAPQFTPDGSIDRPDVMSVAGKALGLNEREQSAALNDYLTTGGQNLDPATTAWCAAFVNATLKQAGVEGTGKLNARSYLDWGQSVDTPQSGDVAVFSRGDPNGWEGHVGFFEGYNPDGTIRVLGGNQGDAVSVASYSPDRLLGFRRAGPAGGSGPVSSTSGSGGGNQPNGVIAALAQAASNPWVARKYGPVVEALMQREMGRENALYEQQLARENAIFGQQIAQQNAQYENALKTSDPAYRQQLEKGALELEALRNPKVKPIEINGQLVDPRTMQVIGDFRTPEKPADGFTLTPGDVRFGPDGKIIAQVDPVAPPAPMTPEQRQQWGIPPEDKRPYAMTPQGPKLIGGEGVTINNNTGGGKFEEKLAELDAKAVGDLSDAGMAAMRNTGRLDRLESLLAQGPSGFEAGAKALLGEYGVETAGLDTLQSAQALVNQLVPEQRQPGSGPMSDADLALFKQSLPRLINSPGGNALIIQTLRAINQYDAEGAAIVQRLRAGELDRVQAFDALQNRKNPLEGMGKNAAKYDAPAGAAGLSGVGWQDAGDGIKIRVKQ